MTLAALRENGVLIDSSYNLSSLDRSCGFQRRPLNVPQALEGVYEFPVTNFNSGRRGSYKSLEISAVSVGEILTTIRDLQKAGCRDVVLVFHSFSFLKNRDVRFEKCRPSRIVIHRFRTLCAELARMRDEIEVSVLGQADVSRGSSRAVSYDPVSGLGPAGGPQSRPGLRLYSLDLRSSLEEICESL